jgi:hypothetical protein
LQNICKCMPVPFHCQGKFGRKQEHWEGIVTALINHGSHYEIHVDSRSGFTFIVGGCIGGNFISIPAFNVGSALVSYDNYFWNHERLSRLLNKVDATTIAEALRTLREHNYI